MCPFGYHVTGGGFDIGSPAIGSSTTGSWVFREVLVSRATKTGWTATAAYTRVKSSGAVSTHRYEPKVYAVCVD